MSKSKEDLKFEVREIEIRRPKKRILLYAKEFV